MEATCKTVTNEKDLFKLASLSQLNNLTCMYTNELTEKVLDGVSKYLPGEHQAKIIELIIEKYRDIKFIEPKAESTFNSVSTVQPWFKDKYGDWCSGQTSNNTLFG